MGLFDKVRQAFRGKSTNNQTTQVPETEPSATSRLDSPFEIGVQEGEIRKGYTAQGTGELQQKFQKPVQTYIADGDMFEVDANKKRLFPDTGNGSIPRGPMAGTWQSRTESYSQADVDRFLDPTSSTYNPANYERLMAQARCDAYAEVQSGAYVWDTMSRDERNAMRISNPQRAQALEQNFFARLDEKYGPDAGEAMAMEYGYTEEDLYEDGITEDWDSRSDADFDRDRDWIGDADMDTVPNRSFTPREAMRELGDSRSEVDANPYLDADAEQASLEALDQEELKTGVVRPQGMYPGNDGFADERKSASLRAGDVVSRFEEKGRPGSTGTFASRAVMGEDGKLTAPSFQDRSMVEFEETMQQHFFQVADDFDDKVGMPPEAASTTDVGIDDHTEKLSSSFVPEASIESSTSANTRVDALRQSLAQSADETSPESVAQAGLGDYFARTGYGPQDKDVYESDPEWQVLHRAAYPDYYAEREQPATKFQPYQETLPASSISGVDTSDPNFWNHHGYDRQNYMELASHLPEVQERLREGTTFDELKGDPVLGPTARAYYSPDDPITVEKQTDGSFAFGSDGRHRIAAAQELGYDVEAKVMYDHGWKAPEQAAIDTTIDTPESIPTTDRLTVTEFSTGESEGIGTEMGTAVSAAQNEAQSGSNVPSASLGDRFQSSYADRIRQTPSLESNRWAGERGGSVCAPQSDAARQILEERGITGVQYQDGVPDFSPFSESTVKLGYMTDARHSQGLTAGRDGKDTIYAHFEDGELVSESHHADKSSMADLHMKYDKPGNFEQADALTAEQWTADERDGKEWTAEDVAQYRQDHGLTWHECNDMETMQMIPEAINADFGHFGGVGEVRETQRIVDEALRDYDDGQMVEAKDYDRMTAEELEAAARQHGHYDDEGVWIPDEEEAQPDQIIDQPQEAIDEASADDPQISERPAMQLEETVQDGSDNPQEQSTPDSNSEAVDQESEEQAAQEAAEQEADEKAVQEAAEQETEEQSAEETVDQRTEEQVLQESVDQEAEEQVAQETAEQETAEQVAQESVDQENEEQATQETAEQEAEEQAAQEAAEKEAEEQAAQEAAEQGTEEQAAQEAVEQETEEQASREAAEQETEEQAAQEDAEQEIAEQEPEEQAAQEAAEQEAEEQAAQEAAEQETEEQAAHEAAEQEAEEQAAQEDAEQEVEEQAAQEAAEQEAEEQATQEAAEQEAEEQTAQEAAEQETEEQAAHEAAEQEAEGQTAEQEAAEQEAEEQVAQEAAEQETEEQTAHEAAEQETEEQVAEQEAAEQEAEEQAAQKAAEQETEEQVAEQEAAEQEAEEQAAQEAAEQEAEEQAAQEAAEQEAAEQEAEEQTAKEAAEQETEEQAVQEAAEQEAEEQTAQEAAEQETEEQAAQEAAEQEAEEQAAQEAEEQAAQETEETYDDLADEQTDEIMDDGEDYSDFEDDPIDEADDYTDYEDFGDAPVEDVATDTADYSDLSDDPDSGSYDDSSIDSSDTSFDSGDTGSFDGGGDSID